MQKGIPNHMCDICGKLFVHSTSFEAHMKYHNNERKISCPHCPQTFVISSHLYRHLQKHVSQFNIQTLIASIEVKKFCSFFIRKKINHMLAPFVAVVLVIWLIKMVEYFLIEFYPIFEFNESCILFSSRETACRWWYS